MTTCRQQVVETINEFIFTVLEPALSAGLGYVICRASCKPELLSGNERTRMKGFNDDEAERILNSIFRDDKKHKSKNVYRVGRNDLLNVLANAPVAKQGKIIFYPKVMKIMNALLIEACKFRQGPHEIGRAIVKRLLSKGADPNSEDKQGNSALMLASIIHPIHKSDTCSLLIKSGAAVNVSILSNFVDNLSHAAGKAGGGRKLYEDEISNYISEDIRSHLKYVVFYGSYFGNLTEDVMAYINSLSLHDKAGGFSKHFKDIQSSPDNNFLPMHYAAMHGNVEMIDLLFRFGGTKCINLRYDANISIEVNRRRFFKSIIVSQLVC